MNNGGVEIDPVTLRPMDNVRKDRVQEHEQLTESTLQRQATWANITDTETGRRIIDIVQWKLDQRIENLVADDAEARAYLNIIKELGGKISLAKSAALKLTERYLKEKW